MQDFSLSLWSFCQNLAIEIRTYLFYLQILWIFINSIFLRFIELLLIPITCQCRLSTVDNAGLLLFPVPAHAGDDGGEKSVEVRPQSSSVILNVDLQLNNSAELG